MRFRRSVLLLALVVLLAATVPLAYASPPDPIWIGGVYDDDDLDDIVVLITWAVGIVESFALDGARPVPAIIASLSLADDALVSSHVLSCSQARAPPTPAP